MTANRPHNLRTFTEERWLHTDLPCRNHPVNTFFPDRGDRATLRKAKHICAWCPAQQECLTYALKHEEPFGIWGGLSPTERAAITEKRPRR